MSSKKFVKNGYNRLMTFIRRYLPVILWSAVIFLFSSCETPPSPQDTLLNLLLKKTAHLIEYAILYLLTFHSFNPRPQRNNQQLTINNYLYPLIFTILYAVSDEIHQSFVSGRHGRAADILIDAAGALIVLLKIKVSNSRH